MFPSHRPEEHWQRSWSITQSRGRKQQSNRSRHLPNRRLSLESLEPRMLLALPAVLKDIYVGSNDSTPTQPFVVGDNTFFMATEPTTGKELYITDGTAAGTKLVKDIRSGNQSGIVGRFASLNNILYFAADDGTHGVELWRSDGTDAGTTLVLDIQTGLPSSQPSSLVAFNGALYFAADNGVNGVELWKTNGTAAGTVMVKDILTGAVGSRPSDLTVVGNTLYFAAEGASGDREIWKTDGTAVGTVLVTQINPTGSANPGNLTAFRNLLLFTANDGTGNVELWKTDGTAAGTAMVKDIYSGATSSGVSLVTVAGNSAFFRADDGVNGVELWKTDGTAAGTVMVKDIYAGATSSIPASLVSVRDTLYFVANDGVTGNELWKSDGTTAGTVLVKDIVPGLTSSSPAYLASACGTLYFAAESPTGGVELWTSQGTDATTTMVADLYPGATSSQPQELIGSTHGLFFSAVDATVGREPWFMSIPNSPVTDFSLAPTTFPEDQPIGTALATFSATDPDSNEFFTYQLVSDSVLGPDNNKFYIEGGQLKVGQPLNYESQITYKIDVRVTDRGGYSLTKQFTLTVTDVNDAPTDIAISATAFSEMSPVGTLVATLDAVDEDAGDSHTFALAADPVLGPDNAKFSISGKKLLIAGPVDFETQPTVRINVMTTDRLGATFTKSLVLTVNNVQEAPTDIVATPNNFPEHLPIGTVVTTLSTVDSDIGDTHTYQLVADTTFGPDNGKFILEVDKLKTNAVFDAAVQSTAKVYVKSTDQTGLSLTKSIILTINNIPEPPTALALDPTQVSAGVAADTVVGVFTTTDPDPGDTFTYTFVAGVNDNANFKIVGDQLRTAVAMPSLSTSYTVQVRTTDSAGFNIWNTFTIQVIKDDPPIARNDVYTINDALAWSQSAPGVLANDNDPEGATITARFLTAPFNDVERATAYGLVTLHADGSFEYTRTTAGPGHDTFQYRAFDGKLISGIATVSMNVRPIGVADAYVNNGTVAAFDVSAAQGVLANDQDWDGDTLQTQLVSEPSFASSFTLNPDGSFHYVRAPGHVGRDSFSYRAFDGYQYSNVITVQLDNRPVGADDLYTNDGTIGRFTIATDRGVLANDYDLDGGTIFAQQVSGPSHATSFLLNPDGSFSYVRDPAWSGRDSFTYRVFDGTNVSSTYTVTLDNRPAANDFIYDVAPDGGPLVVAGPGVLAHASDPNGDAVQVLDYTQPIHGSVIINADGGFTYTRRAGETGRDSFTYRVHDGFGSPTASNWATITLNNRPVGAGDTYNTNEDTPLTVALPGVLANDTDVDLDSLTVVLTSNAAHGNVVLNSNGSFSYTPAGNWFGTGVDADTFTYQVTDGRLFSSATTVRINVAPVNDPPVARDDLYASIGDASFTKAAAAGVLANDTDVEDPQNLLTAVLVSDPGGAITLRPDGSFDFRPEMGFAGDYTFTYQAKDTANALSNVATVTIRCAVPSTFFTLTTVPIQAWENAGTFVKGGTVMVSSPAGVGGLTVYLASNKVDTLQVPATVTILEGQTTAQFDITILNDATPEANLAVQVTAKSWGIATGAASLTVHDDDVGGFHFLSPLDPADALPYSADGMELFPVTVQSTNVSGEFLNYYNGGAVVSAFSGTTALSYTIGGQTLPTTPVSFVNGVANFSVAINELSPTAHLEANNGAGAQGSSRNFVVDGGPAVSFTWGGIGSPETAGLPFPVTLTAKDKHGFTANDFNETTRLYATKAAGLPSGILITEVNEGTPDYVEIHNVSRSAQNVEGWRVLVNDPAAGDVNALYNTAWVLHGQMGIGEITYSSDDPTDASHYWGGDTTKSENLTWGNTTRRGWVMLLNAAGDVADFVAWGYTAEEVRSISLAYNNRAVTVVGQWSGAGVSYAGTERVSLQRSGDIDNNLAADFSWQARTKGTANAGLVTPFATSPMSPRFAAAGTFVNGVWSGIVTIASPGMGVILVADAGSGRTGASNAFDVGDASNTPGLYDPATGRFCLRYTNTAGSAETTLTFGSAKPGWVPLAGDWNNDGVDTIGLYDPATSTFYLRNSNTTGNADLTFKFGTAGAGWIPVVGDWNNDGVDTVALYDPTTSVFHFRKFNTPVSDESTLTFGTPGSVTPIAGDWDGNHSDTVGLYSKATSTFFLTNSLTSSVVDNMIQFGVVGQTYTPLAGDFNGDGADTIGLFAPSTATYRLRNSLSSGAEVAFTYGWPGLNWRPVMGDWNGFLNQTLLAVSEVVNPAADLATLSAAEIQPVVSAAIDRWAAQGIAPALLEAMRRVQFVATNLSGAALGQTIGDRVYLDLNAAGNGWFIDSTPNDDAEFRAVGGQLTAVDPAAVDRIDLLSVVEHELGHIAGLADLEGSDTLMSSRLGSGIRRTVGAVEREALFALGETDWRN